MIRVCLTLFLCLLALPASTAEYGRWSHVLQEQTYLGLGSINDLAGVHLEIANPVGSVYVLLGGHVRGLDIDRWEDGREMGFAAGFRLFSASNGLESSWYVTGFGGTLDVERRREDGRRIGYQRLGLGGGLGYQHVMPRGRIGFSLGVARLESVDTADGERIDREFLPMVETTLGLRF